ncbi:MAG: MlaD family protein, partial [Gemmataceae bacterium]
SGIAMTRSLTRFQAALLGMTMLIAFGLLVVGVFVIGSRQWLWSDTFHLKAGFRQIRGVEPGTRVRVLGREAGEVETVELPATPSGDILLTFRLDAKVRHLIRGDASAQIVAEGMVGGRVVEIHPGSDEGDPVADGTMIASRPSMDVSDVLTGVGRTVAEANVALRDIRDGQGSIGKLLKEPEAYDRMVQLFDDGQRAVKSLRQNSDAIKALPIVRGYVRDAFKELVRPDCARNRRWFTEGDLFEPGHAVLTSQGKTRLDAIAPWVNGLKHDGSEVVVASFAGDSRDGDLARALTQKQAEAVTEYLTSQHSVQKMGWFSWSRRVIPLGLGSDPSPVEEKPALPAPRIEVIVFVPQK